MSRATIVTSWSKRGWSRGFWKDGVGSTKNLHHLHSNCTVLSNRTILELWSIKGLQLPKEGLDCKLGLISISGLHRVAAATLSPSPRAGHYVHLPGAAYTHLTGARVSKLNPALQILVINAFITDCYF